MRRVYFAAILVICAIAVIVPIYLCWFGSVTTVILVRHTEKANSPPDDPQLTPEGLARAQVLAHVVSDAGIDVIFTSEFRRTRATVAPIAARLGLVPVIVPGADIEGLAHSITSEHRGEEVLVAGHSNTVPNIMERLGVSSPPTIADHEYDDLFVVHLHHFVFEHAKLTHLKYGNPSPE